MRDKMIRPKGKGKSRGGEGIKVFRAELINEVQSRTGPIVESGHVGMSKAQATGQFHLTDMTHPRT